MSENVDYDFENEWSGDYPAYKLKPVRTVAPAAYPVSLADIKRHCRATDHTDDDADLQDYLDTAIEQLDGYSGILGRALINQTWRLDLSAFCDVMRLPLEPLSSVTGITYYDGDNASQTLSTDVYGVYTDARGPLVTLKYGQTWPATYTRADAVSITFVAGYGAAASNVPVRLKSAIKLHAADLYAARAASAEKQRYSTMAYERLIKPYQRVY